MLIYGMNETVKCNVDPMTVIPRNSISLVNPPTADYCRCPVSSKSFSANEAHGASASTTSTSTASRFSVNKQTGQHSSLILRQKLLRKSGPNTFNSTGSTRSYRKNNNGFKFHNFVVNQDKKACLEEQHGTKKISVSHWKKHAEEDDVIELNCEKKNLNETANQQQQQQSILESLLASSEEPKKLNKRKPSQIRRVLRPKISEYVVQEEPLDLSFKKAKIDKTEEETAKTSVNKIQKDLKCDNHGSESPSESIQHLIKSVNLSAAQASAIMASVRSAPGPMPDHCSLTGFSGQKSTQQFPTGKQQKQRQTQRSLIKKQLEDAFKQNGFLVKTKQVSDANNSAMFCKFRQLRKYTRYYLKSWHHHLPDEVNKLWKGFLPPKTAKPNSSQ